MKSFIYCNVLIINDLRVVEVVFMQFYYKIAMTKY